MEYVKLGWDGQRQRERGANTRIRQAVQDRTWQGQHEKGQNENDYPPWLLQPHNPEAAAASSFV